MPPGDIAPRAVPTALSLVSQQSLFPLGATLATHVRGGRDIVLAAIAGGGAPPAGPLLSLHESGGSGVVVSVMSLVDGWCVRGRGGMIGRSSHDRRPPHTGPHIENVYRRD